MKIVIIAILVGVMAVSTLHAESINSSPTMGEVPAKEQARLLPVADALVLSVIGLGLVGWGKRHRWVS